MSKLRYNCLYLGLGLLLVLLTACTADAATPTATSAPFTATSTTSPTATPKSLPEATPSPTATALPPTATPMPKLPPLAAGLVYSLGGQLWRVTASGQVVALEVPDWAALSPDGTEAVYTVYEAGKNVLFWQDVLTGEQQRLPDVAEWVVQFPVWWVARPGWLIVGSAEEEEPVYGYLSMMQQTAAISRYSMRMR